MLLNDKRYPSWLFSVTLGTTTIWELWDGIKPDSSFQSVGMNSFNHYAYGAIGEWLYLRVAGISIDSNNPGYKNIIFNPNQGGGLTHAKANIETMYGLTSAKWEIEENEVSYEIEIPSTCTGEVILKNACDIRLEGKQLDDATKIELGSGKYTFQFSIRDFIAL